MPLILLLILLLPRATYNTYYQKQQLYQLYNIKIKNNYILSYLLSVPFFITNNIIHKIPTFPLSLNIAAP